MYQRSYNDDNEISVPRNYDGSLNFEKEDEPCIADEAPNRRCEDEHHGFSKIEERLRSLLPRGFDLGLEEIIIIGAAIIIFTSKSRDFECLLILISLLFIK
jgi:hypothetical protein